MADTCPKFGLAAIGSDKCPGCGFVISLYDFWAKTVVRSYVCAQIGGGGHRCVSHGTGEELLAGFAKAIVFFAIAMVLLGDAPGCLGLGAIATGLGKHGATVLAGVFTPL